MIIFVHADLSLFYIYRKNKVINMINFYSTEINSIFFRILFNITNVTS